MNAFLNHLGSLDVYSACFILLRVSKKDAFVTSYIKFPKIFFSSFLDEALAAKCFEVRKSLVVGLHRAHLLKTSLEVLTTSFQKHFGTSFSHGIILAIFP